MTDMLPAPPPALEPVSAGSDGPSTGDWMSILIAAVLAFAMIFIGIGLTKHEAAAVAGPSFTDYEAYGGDAYTGIQNAAMDTAAAVAESANAQLAMMEQVLGGIGWLLISSGVIVFTVVYVRFAGVRVRT